MDKIFNGVVIFGEMGAGKDALAEQFKNIRENATIYNIGILCREMMKVTKVNPMWKGRERYIGQTTADKFREMDINIMCDYIMALIYERGEEIYGWNNNQLEGEAYNKELLKRISLIRESELSIIVGGRTLTDLKYWKEKNYLIIGIKVSDEVRKYRLINRDGKEIVQNSSSVHNTESDVPKIINEFCDEVIVNDGSLMDLKKSAEGLLKKYNF
jgi:dephospho-CoA kinase